MVLGQGATTRPAGAFPGLDRLSSALDSMDLSDDQKGQIQTLLDKAKDQILQFRQEGQIAQARQVLQEIRAQLPSILTPAQLQELRQKMQASPADRTGSAPPSMEQTTQATQKSDSAATEVASKLVEMGQTVPDFRLSKMDGSFLTPASLKGHVVVLVFGSYSSPMLRDRVVGLNQLTLAVETKADLYLVYTNEMHPIGGWGSTRNELDHIAVQQPKTMDEKEAAARQCRGKLRLNMPVVADDLQDSAATALGTFPDGAVVLNRDGTIAGSQQWAEPTALRRIVDEATTKELHSGEPQ